MDGFEIVAAFFEGVIEGIRKSKYLLLAIGIILAILVIIFIRQNQAKDDCRGKGGVPLNDSYGGVTCVKGTEIK